MDTKTPNINSGIDKKTILDLLQLVKMGKFNLAENKARTLITRYPNAFLIYSILGLCLINQNQIKKGIDCYKIAIKIKPNFFQAYNDLGIVYKNIGKIDEAIICYENAIKFKPDFAEAYNNLGLILMDKGKITEAKEKFRKVISLNPSFAYAHRHLSVITKYTKNDSHIEEMKKAFEDKKIQDTQKMHLSFALGKAFEDLQEYENAFEYFTIGNKLRRAKFNYNINNDVIFFESLKKIFNKDLLKKFESHGNQDKTPIFIVGMFRSGTTLVEQILSSHPKVFGGGESRVLNQIIINSITQKTSNKIPKNLSEFDSLTFNKIGNSYINAARKFQPKYEYITDKQPTNFRWIGFIKLALPNAKIIHCTRNPMDNCLSIYKNYFNFNDNPYSYNLDELGQYYNLYKNIMNFWHNLIPGFIYDISYEKLIENQEEETRKLLDKCSLEWDENCINFFKNKRSVNTASVMQVRKPLYKDSIESWKKYEKNLSPLVKRLNLE